MRVREIASKPVLRKSNLPDVTYVINPYLGCGFGCRYCFASRYGGTMGEPNGEWGNYVYVNTDAVAVLNEELSRLSIQELSSAKVLMSSETDPYQSCEATYRLTRGILEIICTRSHPFLVSILTKSPLVLRDLSILNELPRVEVGMSIATVDDNLAGIIEPKAPKVTDRLRVLERLSAAGISTFAFVGPLLPHFSSQPDRLDALFAALSNVGVRSAYVEHLNLSSNVRDRFWSTFLNVSAPVMDCCEDTQLPALHCALDRMVRQSMCRHDIELRLGQILYMGKSKPDEVEK